MLAREFQCAHDVLVVGFSRLYPSLLFPGRTQYDQGGALVRFDSARLIDSVNPATFVRAARAVVAFSPSLVVVQWWHPFFAPAFRAIARRVRHESTAPIVYLCHNVLPHESAGVTRALARWGLAAADAYLVQSSEDRVRLQEFVPNAIVAVHPHPIYTQFATGAVTREDARARLGVEGRVILFFGLVRAYKGLDQLLRAFALVAERLRATLMVVGEFYDDRAPYDRAITSLGIGARVRVVDRYVPDDEVGVYFSAADLVVLPYKSATQSGIVQTAFAFERPVVVTAVGGLPDVVRDGVTGFVVPPGNPAALAEAMERFFAGDHAARMAEAIRADAARFSWNGCARALLELGERVRAAR
ncbi:MAG: glycosyltransferase [Candidatus Latescibacteria bacterium]|nr:glycosyltransferase [Candidatus Latescibacterota bacterium]